jgi:poly-gamma-glutamate synthesis protein (capsule biosynthesis protein)
MRTSLTDSRPLRLAALGDLMLAGEWDIVSRRRGECAAFAALRAAIEDADLVFANLETTVEAGDGHIPKEPRVLGDLESMRRSLAAIGVGVVNLANNHAFDGDLAGFEAVRRLLEEEGIAYFGAGRDAREAGCPLVLERGGLRLGWLGYVALDTRPSHVAGPSTPGVNPLEAARAFADVARLKADVDHVFVSLHWGVEFCHQPSPEQLAVARGLVDHGATFVIGHHAHVIQGIERRRHGVIAYGLGNATTTDFAIGGRLAIRQTRRTRSSLLLRAQLGQDGVRHVDAVPLRADGPRILVGDAHAGRLLARANRQLARAGSAARWKARRLVEDVVLRTAWKLDPRVIGSVRPRHVARVFQNVFGAVTGRGPAA